jgi:hypothetical protein
MAGKQVMDSAAEPTAIRPADELIREATQRLAAIDRELAALQRLSRRRSAMKLREQTSVARIRRDMAYMELVELIELAEMPPEFMGWA